MYGRGWQVRPKTMREHFWGPLFVAGACGGICLSLGALGLGGCSTGSKDNGFAPSAPSQPASVVIDFYKGAQQTAACSGTLLTGNVVLTAAHCAVGATGARVVAPDAQGQTTTARETFVFGWNPKSNPAMQHDLALVILRSPIAAPQYARIQRESCDGCTVVSVYRTGGTDEVHAQIAQTPSMQLAAHRTAAQPLALAAPMGPDDAGGAVIRVDDAGNQWLVGVTTGQGHETKSGYEAAVDDPDVQN